MIFRSWLGDKGMLHTLKLLLPALFPSWRFFDVIAPSPRIQYALFDSGSERITEWQEFRPRPVKVSPLKMLKRMVWNSAWNESLYLVSCAERLIEFPTRHSENEILTRIATELSKVGVDSQNANGKSLQFRLMTIRRVEGRLEQEVVFYSRKDVLMPGMHE